MARPATDPQLSSAPSTQHAASAHSTTSTAHSPSPAAVSPIQSSQSSPLPPDLVFQSRSTPADRSSTEHSQSLNHSNLNHTDSNENVRPRYPTSHDDDHHHHHTDVYHDGTTAAPTPETATEHKVNLQDQTNFLPKKQVILVFSGLSAALFVSLLDQSIISTSLSTITESFHAGNQSSWLSTSYLLTSTAASPLYGRFSDIFGRKVCIIFALTGFLIGSALCAAAQSITQLIVFRAFAGAFGGGIVSLVMVVVGDVVSLRERGTYQGLLGVVVAISNAGGPLIGGALSSVNWRWCFIIAIPIGLIALTNVIILLPLKKVQGSVKSKLAKIDYLGTVLVLSGSVLLLLGLNWGGQQYSWSSPHVLVTLILGIVIFIVFAAVEARFATLPLVPMRLFKVGTVCSVMVQTVCSGGIFYLLLFFVPQFSQVIKGYSGVKAGVTLIPLMVVQAVTSTVSGIVVSKTGKYKAIIVIGFGIFSVGVGLLGLLKQNTSIGEIIGFLLLSGFGAGGTLQVTLVAAQNAVDRRDLAVVTSTRNFMRLFGGTLCLAISYTILNNTVNSHVKGLPADVIRQVVRNPKLITDGRFDAATSDLLLQAYVQAFRNVFRFGLGLTLLAFVVTVLFTKEYSLDRNDDEKRKEEGKQWYAEKKERKHAKKHLGEHSEMQSGRQSHDSQAHQEAEAGVTTTQREVDLEKGAVPAAIVR
ncbi:related to tetracycline efflux protein (otrb) [Melanopsichium pennsylvanicum]|uniref:Related to tetracycline efflux protein (Otrb) n=2 Tax=Melanopsichium pennsylvanicum TaxID=63383 RepID=A0AAJ4XRP8_9BASI|nr:mfs general substrate transporter [Melanopsichium pennsylvanicum 4]SNX85853.1 related to tetracycline efflux protein (otrb) [Melanopsichium pennsylvanicum]